MSRIIISAGISAVALLLFYVSSKTLGVSNAVVRQYLPVVGIILILLFVQTAIALFSSGLAEKPEFAARWFWLYGLLSVSGGVLLATLLFGDILFTQRLFLDYTDAYMWFVLIIAYLGFSLLLAKLFLRIAPDNMWRFSRSLLISHGVILLLAYISWCVVKWQEYGATHQR